MKFKQVVFLLLLIVFSIFFSVMVGMIFNYNVFDLRNFDFQFIIFSLLLSFVYYTTKTLRLLDSIIVVFGFSLIYTYILKSTNLLGMLGGIIPLLIYTFCLFLSISLIFILIWFAKARYLRNLIFSILAAISYTFVHILVHLFIKEPPQAQFVTYYFKIAIVIMLTISTAFSVAEYVFSFLEKKFFSESQRVIPEDIEEKNNSHKKH